MKKMFLIMGFLVGIISHSTAQKVIQIDNNQINKIVGKLKDSLNIPGIAVGIAIGNEIKYINASGYENLESKTELTTSSTWHLCSISKQFTTVACLKLVEEKKLSLQDKISQYIGDLPETFNEITISNLLSHTSGIKDYLNEKNLYGVPWGEVKKQVFSDTLNFKPGGAWSYSNMGFWTAAKIVEKITGMDYGQYLEKTFFTKLKMEGTQRVSGNRNAKSHVNGYVFNDNRFNSPIEDMNRFYGQGDGDISSTLNDLMKWNIALTHGKLIKEESLSELWTPTKLNNGKILEAIPNSGMNYGMGWFIRNQDGNKIVWTPGSGFGFSTSSQYVPGYDLTVIVFCNKEQFLMADEIGFAIIKNILGEM